MRTLARLPLATWPLLGLPLLVVALLSGSLNGHRRTRDPYAANPALHTWDLPQALDHLRAQGLAFEVVPTDSRGEVGRSAYLTTDGRDFNELNVLPMNRARLDRWRGVLYCERLHFLPPDDPRAEDWGDAGLRAGPFLFFGDPEMLAEVREALRRPSRASKK